MEIELLKFKIAPEYREQYIQRDTEIWTAALAHYPGFIGKELWINRSYKSGHIYPYVDISRQKRL